MRMTSDVLPLCRFATTSTTKMIEIVPQISTVHYTGMYNLTGSYPLEELVHIYPRRARPLERLVIGLAKCLYSRIFMV